VKLCFFIWHFCTASNIILNDLKLHSLSLSLSPVTAPCCHKQVRGQLDKHVATAPASDISGARGGPEGNGVMELMQVCVHVYSLLLCVCVCTVYCVKSDVLNFSSLSPSLRHPFSFLLSSPHLTAFHFFSSLPHHRTSFHLISPHLISPHLTSPHLYSLSPHYFSTVSIEREKQRW
jgi:hypothetical protein